MGSIDSVYVASHSLPKYSDPINIKTGNVVLTDNGKSATAPLILSGDTIDYVGHGFFTGDEVYYKPDEFVEYDASYGEPIYFKKSQNIKKCKSILIKAMEDREP